MGALIFFLEADEVYLRSKYLIYMGIHISLLLWGCEVWELTKIFLTRSITFKVGKNNCENKIK